MNEINTFEDCYKNNSIVHEGFLQGISKESIIVLLCRHAKHLEERILELEAICPKKIEGSDGRVFVWQCPERMIPLTEIPYNAPKC